MYNYDEILVLRRFFVDNNNKSFETCKRRDLCQIFDPCRRSYFCLVCFLSIFHCRQKERLQTKLKLNNDALALFYVDACKDCLSFVASQPSKTAADWHKSRPAKFQDVSTPAAITKLLIEWFHIMYVFIYIVIEGHFLR